MSEAHREQLALVRRTGKRSMIQAAVLIGTVPLAGAVVVWLLNDRQEHVLSTAALLIYLATALGLGPWLGLRGAAQLVYVAKAERALDEARLPVAKLLR